MWCTTPGADPGQCKQTHLPKEPIAPAGELGWVMGPPLPALRAAIGGSAEGFWLHNRRAA